jgi:hypothetical protein
MPRKIQNIPNVNPFVPEAGQQESDDELEIKPQPKPQPKLKPSLVETKPKQQAIVAEDLINAVIEPKVIEPKVALLEPENDIII